VYPALIDCDVHEDVRGVDCVLPYLPAGWREFAANEHVALLDGNKSFGTNPWGYHRKDSIPPDGGPPGSSPEFMVEQLLDAHDVSYAVLTGDAMSLAVSSLANPHLGREVARALNDYRAERWHAVDPRFLGSICLPLQVPEWAAAEVRRLAGQPQFVQVCACTNPHAHAFGHPMYDPVHRACADTGRPFAVHALGQSAGGAGVAHLGGGTPAYYSEFHGGAAQEMMTAAMSFIFNGVFERYPTLKLVLLEAGSVGWIPPFLRRLDADFKGLHREVPWCKKLPSEYFAGHIRVATQPYDHDRPDDVLLAGLDEIGGEDFLLFATDYPHWDADMPKRALSAMPRHWRDKVAYANAADTYTLDLPVPA
jgi:uncharacterized protein